MKSSDKLHVVDCLDTWTDCSRTHDELGEVRVNYFQFSNIFKAVFSLIKKISVHPILTITNSINIRLFRPNPHVKSRGNNVTLEYSKV